jgi:hypothetical protein
VLHPEHDELCFVMNCYVVLHIAVKGCCFYKGSVGGVLYTQVKLRILGGLEFWISYPVSAMRLKAKYLS